MKKLIAISVVFALLAMTAFAETSVGGNLKLGVSLISGDDGGGDARSGKLTFWDSHANVNFSDGSAGGMLRVHAGGQGAGSGQIDWTPGIFTFGWWKPIDQLRIQLGVNPDGDWGHAQISGWGFNGEAQGGTALDQHRGLGNGGNGDGDPVANSSFQIVARTTKGWYGGFSAVGAAISIYPVQGLTINWGIPFGSQGELGDTFGRSHFGVIYGIPDIGTVRVAAVLTNPDASDLPVNFYGSFYLMAIDGLGVDIGVGYEGASEVLGIGLGLRYTAGDFGIKLRFGVDLEDPDASLGVQILPSYNIGGTVIFLNAGVGMRGEDLSWYANPYVRVPMGGGMSFYGGFQLWDKGDEVVRWAVPITYNFYF